ncbi:hypothetical protein [Pseudomonas sp. MPDS]|uniref:DinB/UmuC family translesion DNA polymerase n=1 Tax=Pseudomonas sp. MPDS TaxID=2762896 RepID=UPI0028D67336|nr:hypothetical protein [Pseudomonas sp. MPDS]
MSSAGLYAQRVAEKLRARNSLCKKLRVSIRSGMFSPGGSQVCQWGTRGVGLPYPTNDVRLLSKAATEAVNWIFRPGIKYSKAEVLFMGLR